VNIFGLHTSTELLNARAESHNVGYAKGCEQAERIAQALRTESLRPMVDLLIQRRGECPKGSPLAAVTYLVNQLEVAETTKDNVARLLWEIVSQYVPDEGLPEINVRVLRVLGHPNHGM
jgi:hypothetical protein